MARFPYLFLFLVPGNIRAINKQIFIIAGINLNPAGKKAKGTGNNNQQPLILISCNLLTVTASPGRKFTKTKIRTKTLIGDSSAGDNLEKKCDYKYS